MPLRRPTIILALLAVAAASPGAPATVTTVGGQTFEGQLVSLSDTEAVFTTDAGRRSVPVRDLWQIRLSGYEDLMRLPGQKVVALRDGGKLAATTLSFQENKASIANALFGSAVVDVAVVEGIYMPSGDERPDGCLNRIEAMKLPETKTDYLVASDKAGRWVPVAGVLKKISDGKVIFEYRGEDRATSLDIVHALKFAAVPRPGDQPLGRVIGKDGSVVPFTSISVSGARMKLSAAGLDIANAAVEGVAEINFRSDRCTYLSDLDPAQVSQVGLFDVAFPFRRDRSAAGGALRIGGVNYARGLGLHSRCELAYDLGGAYASFAATVGIDEAGGNRGSATLRILGDGKELKAIDVAAGADPIPINITVTGVKRLTIIVDFGRDNIDVGDFVDLAEARLIKP